MRLVGPDDPVPLFLLELVGGVAAQVADLDPGLLHPLVDDSDEVLATLLGEWRDVEPDDRPVDVGHQPDVALGDRLLDGAEDAAVPRLDDDLVRLRDADPGELVERRRRAVVLDVDALDERGRRAAGPDALEVALHGLDGARHLVIGVGDDLAAHAERTSGGARGARDEGPDGFAGGDPRDVVRSIEIEYDDRAGRSPCTG